MKQTAALFPHDDNWSQSSSTTQKSKKEPTIVQRRTGQANVTIELGQDEITSRTGPPSRFGLASEGNSKAKNKAIREEKERGKRMHQV